MLLWWHPSIMCGWQVMWDPPSFRGTKTDAYILKNLTLSKQHKVRTLSPVLIATEAGMYAPCCGRLVQIRCNYMHLLWQIDGELDKFKVEGLEPGAKYSFTLQACSSAGDCTLVFRLLCFHPAFFHLRSHAFITTTPTSSSPLPC